MKKIITKTFKINYNERLQNFVLISYPVLVLFNINHKTEVCVFPQILFLTALQTLPSFRSHPPQGLTIFMSLYTKVMYQVALFPIQCEYDGLIEVFFISN
jgi:hypothetical protein